MVKILFLASNPDRTSPLQLDEEIRAITSKIRASDYRDVLELTSLWAVRPDDLLQALNEHKPQIVHFSGHGSAAGEIVLMDDDRKDKPVSTAALKMLFTTLKDNIRVVVLNACYSRIQAEAITEVIDCAVGMNAAIGDQAAVTFAASFYRAIGFGRSVQEAFDQGRTALLLEGVPEEDIPELLVRRGINPASILLIEHPDISQSVFEKSQSEAVAETVELLPRIEDAQILRGDPTSGHAIEVLLHNPAHREVLVRRATIGCWKPDTRHYFMPPPTYTYELNLQLEACSSQDDGFSVQGVAKEPEDGWGRPASGYFLKCGGHLEFEVSFPLYLQIASKERGLIRFALKKPQLNPSAGVAPRLHETDHSILESAPTFGENSDYLTGQTYLVLEGDWGRPIAAKLGDHTLLKVIGDVGFR
jgi:hypothetical protein